MVGAFPAYNSVNEAFVYHLSSTDTQGGEGGGEQFTASEPQYLESASQTLDVLDVGDETCILAASGHNLLLNIVATSPDHETHYFCRHE